MTYRANDPFIKNCYSQSESRLNQQIRYDATDEGCPVIESGTICGETNSFDIFEEFRQIYNDCIKKLEECQDDNSTVKKLAPFRKLVEDLWEQNALLVEAVVELEQEATCTVSNLQDKLKKSCQKVAANLKNIFNLMNEYKEDIKSLVEIVKKYSGSSTFDFKGIKFKTDNVLSMWEDNECSTSKYLSYDETCKFDSSTLPGKYSTPQQTMKMKGLIGNSLRTKDQRKEAFLEAEGRLKVGNKLQKNLIVGNNAKDPLPQKNVMLQEVECLSKKLLEKDEILKKYCCQIEQLQKDVKNKNKKYKEILQKLKFVTQKEHTGCFEDVSEVTDDCDLALLEKSINSDFKNMEDQRNIATNQDAERHLKIVPSENILLKDKNEMSCKLDSLNANRDNLLKKITDKNNETPEKEEMLITLEQLKSEKKELMNKIIHLEENLKDLNINFKETRWALTSEVAEKHDQVQELRKVVATLEEQLRQADMQTHFKDDIIKELRKELKSSRKSTPNVDQPIKALVRQHSPPTQLISLKPVGLLNSEKSSNEDKLKLDIQIFSLHDPEDKKLAHKNFDDYFKVNSVEVQTEPCRNLPLLKMRNVSTQHKSRVQKLPRSFGTLTVTPWSGAVGEVTNANSNVQDLKETKKNQRGIYTVP